MVLVSWKADSAMGGVCGRDSGALEIEVFDCLLTMMGSGKGWGYCVCCAVGVVAECVVRCITGMR